MRTKRLTIEIEVGIAPQVGVVRVIIIAP